MTTPTRMLSHRHLPGPNPVPCSARACGHAKLCHVVNPSRMRSRRRLLVPELFHARLEPVGVQDLSSHQ